jgi:hypothetical protein
MAASTSDQTNARETTSGAARDPDTVPGIPVDASALGPVPNNPTRQSGARVQQVKTAASKMKPRVAKIRKASSVVLDEATYDPGIRFLLVVSVLFLLVLGLLFLSKWIT